MIFVYGTLMTGERNHAQLRGLPCAGPARTAPAYSLHDLGPYPALVQGGETSVVGELYDVPPELVPSLDAFEGVPTLYQRVWIQLEDGQAEAYVMRPELVAGRPVIGTGDWRTKATTS